MIKKLDFYKSFNPDLTPKEMLQYGVFGGSYLGETINILLPNGKRQNVFLKNLNFDGSILIEKDGKEENIFSARIVNDIN